MLLFVLFLFELGTKRRAKHNIGSTLAGLCCKKNKTNFDSNKSFSSFINGVFQLLLTIFRLTIMLPVYKFCATALQSFSAFVEAAIFYLLFYWRVFAAPGFSLKSKMLLNGFEIFLCCFFGSIFFQDSLK